MKYNELDVTTRKKTKRVGRGISAGQGKTAGRGTKGQKSRTGHRKMPVTFMGGQRALMQAVPKRRGDGKGVRNITINTRHPVENVYIDTLNTLKGDVDNFVLAENKLISSPYLRVKVIVRGELTAKITLKTQMASKPAIEMIKKAGGSFVKTTTPGRQKTEK
jgi:large subunit ribosomal protein L15